MYTYNRTNVLAPATIAFNTFVALPVPPQLVDATAVVYSEKENNFLVGAVFDALSATRNQHAGQAAWGTSFNTGAAAAAGAARVAVAAGNALVSGAGNAAEALLGVQGNPFLTVQFQSPQFKQHEFSWTFSPNSPDESATLNAIINLLRFNMLPNLVPGAAGIFLGYPSVFLPILVPNGNAELYVFKHCVLNSMVVNYAPSGVPAFYTGTKAPVAVSMTLHFLSIEIDLQDTYGTNF